MASHKEGEEKKQENPLFAACGREGGLAKQ